MVFFEPPFQCRRDEEDSNTWRWLPIYWLSYICCGPRRAELSPTLVDLSKLAPDLNALFHNLNPLFDLAKAGLPATEAFLDELHPLAGQLRRAAARG